MKLGAKQGIILLILLLPLMVTAQSSRIEVPWEVKVQFMEDYISASATRWGKQGDQYVVDFLHQSHDKIATYSNYGRRLTTEVKLASLSQVPASVIRSLSKRFKNYLIEERVKIETPQAVSYKFVVRKKCKTYEIEYSDTGKFKINNRITTPCNE